MSVEKTVGKVVMACLRSLAGVLARAFMGVSWPTWPTAHLGPSLSTLALPPKTPGNVFVQDVSTEERISVPRMMQMLNPVRSKQAILPLLHLAAATSLTTSTLQQNCHRITVIDGTTYSLAHQG